MKSVFSKTIIETIIEHSFKEEKDTQRSSGAHKQALDMGLEYYGFGRYGKDKKVTHHSENGKLVPVKTYDYNDQPNYGGPVRSIKIHDDPYAEPSKQPSAQSTINWDTFKFASPSDAQYVPLFKKALEKAGGNIDQLDSIISKKIAEYEADPDIKASRLQLQKNKSRPVNNELREKHRRLDQCYQIKKILDILKKRDPYSHLRAKDAPK